MATLTVTTLVDENDGGAGGTGVSLREALALAATADTIAFDAALIGGSTSGVDDGIILLGGTELAVATAVTINGDVDGDGHADITVSGNNASRVFNIDDGAGATAITATLNGLIIRDGAADYGAGILVAGDTLIVTNSTITANVASFDGGGIHSTGTLNVTHSTLSGNQTGRNGGAIFNYQPDAELTLDSSTVSGNVAGYIGGGVANRFGDATLTNTTVAGNAADYSGGVWNGDGTLVLINSTVSGNIASVDVGGVWNNGSPATTTLTNTIVAGNSDGGPGDDDVQNLFGVLTLSGGNIVGGERTIDGASQQTGIALTDIFASVTNNPDTGVLSGTLADNGGPIQTIALNAAAANPALDAGDDTHAPTTDARDAPRDDVAGAANHGSNISDLGALELQATPADLVVTTLLDGGNDDYGGGDIFAEMADGDGLSLREALALANADPDANTITFDPGLVFGPFGGTVVLDGVELEISSDVTIDGDVDGDGSADIAIDGDDDSRVLNITGGNVALDALILAGGDDSGVAVASTAAVTITNSAIVHNTGTDGGGIFLDDGAELTLISSTVSGNSASFDGGGIYGSQLASITLINSTVSHNVAEGGGGGIYGFSDNAITLISSTVTGNYAQDEGGGIYNYGSAGITSLTNSIVAGNVAGSANDLTGSANAHLVLGGANILGSAPADFASQSGTAPIVIDGSSETALKTVFDDVALIDLDGPGGDPGFFAGVLADNGGAVPTVAINPTGIAHDAGDDAAAGSIPTDARGFDRTVGAHVDIGAFEQQAAQSFIVTTLGDELDSLDPNATLADFGPTLSLREALVLANHDPASVDMITFAAALTGGTTPGVDDGVLLLTQGELFIDGDVTIDGEVAGLPRITIDAQDDSAAFVVFAGTSTLNGLTLTGGYSGAGGAIVIGAYGYADVTISNSVLTGNYAEDGGAIFISPVGSLRLIDSTVSGNQAYYSGGGIYNLGGTLTIINSTLSGNTADVGGSGFSYGGGGLYNIGSATLINTTLSGNHGGIAGGGIGNSGDLLLINTTLANNDADAGGGLYNASCGCGDATLINSTISGNYAVYDGGGIASYAGTVTLTNSIVAGNSSGAGAPDIYGAMTLAGKNVFSQAGIGRAGIDILEGNLLNIFAAVDPLTGGGQLANNGGAVQTMVIKVVGGKAFNAGDNSALLLDTEDLDGDHNTGEVLPFDARGLARIVGGTVDIGAFEAQQNIAPVNTVPGTQPIEANTATSIAGLSITDADAGAGAMTTTLSVTHGTLTVSAVGGAGVGGSGSSTVTITGTQAQINATLGAGSNIVYLGTHDYFGTDTLHVVTNDGGNNGAGGPLTDTDDVTINVNTLITGTTGDDSYTALTGNERIDAGYGVDTVTFGFKLVEATITWSGHLVIIDGPSSHTVLTGVETYVFTDGTVDNNDGNRLVNDLFYYAQNHDVWNAHVDADAHYDIFGWHERRDPNAFFSTTTYLALNPDVKAAGVNPLDHWYSSGWTESRLPSFAFDPAAHLAQNPDVAAAHVDPLWHFLIVGAGEGRQPTPVTALIAANGFDAVYYLQQNPDVAAAEVDPFSHFQTTGWHEGRNPNALFDTAGYLAHYTDVAAAGINPLDHYHLVGWTEGRDPSLGFDTAAYLAANPDVAPAHFDPLWHYLRLGIHEGRVAIADGTWG